MHVFLFQQNYFTQQPATLPLVACCYQGYRAFRTLLTLIRLAVPQLTEPEQQKGNNKYRG